MKGIIFNVLEDMVVEQLGMEVWNELLQSHTPEGRVYVSVKNYDAGELFAMANGVALRLNMPLQDVVKAFGQFLFKGLADRHLDVVERFTDFTSLVMGIHDVIHLEVNKLYQDPSLPTISCRISRPGHIEMNYNSPRKLCLCAEGLLFGAAEYFDQAINITHAVCMHKGAQQCILHIEVADE
ncbi:heme NO-binding domain-containing protein [Pseudoalteromonas sp. SR44-8]|uniref:heme NO-binding domain-containing protein n=1 Tax=Pseudoalteromonas sp. SR44-8 TaxID=2760933 RepID=UPI0016032218|nr:heme NO-binding domain-containing protein [Pseudoalteromonas sp. SR44-8]MBB1302765.1 heme NO-binding domain-containing protein [Pseudoalteromonas sp. SR44-8]